MLHNRIVYTCKKCGNVLGSILVEWEDVKPKFCLNRKCKANFLLNPELLDIKRPEPQVLEQPKEEKPKKKKDK